jgi:Ubiquitin-2 like Rad60 SUMO-like
MSSSSSSDDDSQAEVAALFNKSAMKQKQQAQTKRRLSSTSPPQFLNPTTTTRGEAQSSSSPTAAASSLAACNKNVPNDDKTSENGDDDEEQEEDDDDDNDVAVSSGRATKRRKNKKNNVDNRLAVLAQKRAIRERQLNVQLLQQKTNWNDSDDDDSSDDEPGGGAAALTKNMDKGRIAINVQTKVYDEDGNCCSNTNQENTLPGATTRTTRSTATAAAAAGGGAAHPSSSQPDVYELSDSSDDDEKPSLTRRRPGVAAIDPATIVAAAQGTGVDASALLQARQAMMKLQSQVLDCDDNDDDDDDDDYDDLQSSSLYPSNSSLVHNAPPPRLLQLNVVTTLEDLDGGVEEKTVVISMLSNETFKGLRENLLEQLFLPKKSSVTLRFQEHAVYISQTPDTISTSMIKSATNSTEPTTTTNTIMESGSTLHARIFGVSSKKAAASAVKKSNAASSSASTSTAANFGPSLSLTLRGKDGQVETFKLRQREPFQALVDAYRIKKSTIAADSRIILQFDGQTLQMTQTPLQCDMESDDLIDVQVVN